MDIDTFRALNEKGMTLDGLYPCGWRKDKDHPCKFIVTLDTMVLSCGQLARLTSTPGFLCVAVEPHLAKISRLEAVFVFRL